MNHFARCSFLDFAVVRCDFEQRLLQIYNQIFEYIETRKDRQREWVRERETLQKCKSDDNVPKS